MIPLITANGIPYKTTSVWAVAVDIDLELFSFTQFANDKNAPIPLINVY